MNCGTVDEWTVEENWVLRDVSQDRRIILVARPGAGAGISEFLLVDPFHHRIVRRWPAESVHGQRFADYGKAICSASGVYGPRTSPIECFAADSGERIGTALTINGGLPFAVASQAARLVGSDYRQRFSLTSDDLFTAVLNRRVVWDIRTGRELASWRPPYQEYDFHFADGTSRLMRDPFRFALSPDGQYLAEGGNGKLTVYKIQL